jgi:hypothetical protein
LTSIRRGSGFRTNKKSKTLIFAIILIVGVIITLSAVWAFRNANNTSNPNYKNHLLT